MGSRPMAITSGRAHERGPKSSRGRRAGSGVTPGSVGGQVPCELVMPRHRRYPRRHAAGWSSLVARRAHNPKVAGSNPAPATNESPRSEALIREIGEGLSGVSGADFYTVFYTAGWDALGRTGPGRHAVGGTAWQIGCPRPAVGRRSGSSVVSLTGAALCPVGRLGPALDAAWRLFRIES